jgi:hypothetical protein
VGLGRPDQRHPAGGELATIEPTTEVPDIPEEQDADQAVGLVPRPLVIGNWHRGRIAFSPVPDGKPRKIAVVAGSFPEAGRSIPRVIRDNSGRGGFDVHVQAMAKDSAGRVVVTGDTGDYRVWLLRRGRIWSRRWRPPPLSVGVEPSHLA